MGITTTIAKLKTYFEAWHKTTPHDDLNNNISGLEERIEAAESKIDNYIEDVDGVFTNPYKTSLECSNYRPAPGQRIALYAKVVDLYGNTVSAGKNVIFYKKNDTNQEHLGQATTNNNGIATLYTTIDIDDNPIITFMANDAQTQCYMDWYIDVRGGEEEDKDFYQKIEYHNKIVTFTFKTPKIKIKKGKWADCGTFQFDSNKFLPQYDIFIQYNADIVIRLYANGQMQATSYGQDYIDDRYQFSGTCTYKVR